MLSSRPFPLSRSKTLVALLACLALALLAIPSGGRAAPGGGGEELVVSPAPLVFPTTTKWMNSEKTLTVTNPTGAPVSLYGTNFEGPGSGSFGTNGSSCGAMLMVGESCTIAVRFSPQAAGDQRPSLHVGASVPSGEPRVELEGLRPLP